MRTIDITEANEWKQTLIDVAQSIQDKSTIMGVWSDWDKRVYNEIVEIEKKLEQLIASQSRQVPETTDDEPPKYPTSWRDFTMTDKIEDKNEQMSIQHIKKLAKLLSRGIADKYKRILAIINEDEQPVIKTESEIICTSDILACKHKGDDTCAICCYNASKNNIPVDETGNPNPKGYFVRQSAKEWIRKNGDRITNASGLTDSDRTTVGFLLMPEVIMAMEEFASQSVPVEITDEMIKDEARKAANASQFMSNWIYEHKSYEDGFNKGAEFIKSRTGNMREDEFTDEDADHAITGN